MDEEVKRALFAQTSYCQTLVDHPAVNVTIDGNAHVRRVGNEQQKLASQRPRGTRIDDTGTRIQVKGSRNYTSRKLFISREEMFDDVVVRGLRADGLSTKLGVKNHKDGISKMLIELFQGDSRLPVIEEHFRTHRQKSNSAKTMFATMTHEELQFLKAETFPSRIDVQVRDYLTNAFVDQPHKLQDTVEVLGQVQQIFKALTPHTDFLSSHNFQTRGFFLDIVLMTCSFLMQIIQDSDGNLESLDHQEAEISENCRKFQNPGEETAPVTVEEKNKTAAETLLSVGSNILDNVGSTKTASSQSRATVPSLKINRRNKTIEYQVIDGSTSSNSGVQPTLPTTVVVEGEEKAAEEESEEWTTVEMVDVNGNARYVFIKTDAEDGEQFDTSKILNLLQSQGVNLDEKIEVALNHQNGVPTGTMAASKPSSVNNITLEVLQAPSEGKIPTTGLRELVRSSTVTTVENDAAVEPLQDQKTRRHDSASDILSQLAKDVSGAKTVTAPQKKRMRSDDGRNAVKKRSKRNEL